jgi:hypothetical protein
MPAMARLYDGFLAFHHIMPSTINNSDSISEPDSLNIMPSAINSTDIEPDSSKQASTVDRLRNYNSVPIKDVSEGVFSLLSK